MLIGYARISTVDQKLDLQIDALKQAGCEKIFRDAGYTGKNTKRPALEKALRHIKEGDNFVVWRLDRLGRSMNDLTSIVSKIEKKGVEFRSICDAIDTSTPHGKFFFYIIGAVSEYETSMNSERTKAGMTAAKARGVKLGRPKKLPPEQKAQITNFNSKCLDATARSIGADNSPALKDDETIQ